MKMEVYTPNLELIGILENWDNLIIEDCAFTSGSFSFNSTLNDNTRNLFKEDNIIWFDDETAGIIEYFDKISDEYGISFTIKGSLLTGLLKRRVLWGLYNYNASPTKIMYNTVTDCIISPTRGNVTARKIDNFSLKEQPEDTRTIRKQQTGGDLLSFCEEIGQATNTAFGVAFDPLDSKMKFWCRPCKNRTIHQSVNEPVFYSTELDDVLSANYSYDASNYKNVAFVQGEGEGINRTNTTIYKEIETILPEEPSLLPNGYTQLEYIETSGTQWINTGIAPDGKLKIKGKFQFLKFEKTHQSLFGSREMSPYINSTAIYLPPSESAEGERIRIDYGASIQTKYAVNTDPLQPFTFLSNGNIFYVNDEEIIFTKSEFEGTYPILFGASSDSEQILMKSSSRIFEVSIAKERDYKFIPCKNPDGNIGMYEIYGAKFYGNSGTGEFIAGNEVVKTKATINSNEPQGISRYEMYIDAKDLQKNSDPEHPMTDEEYLQALNTRGQEKLSDAQLVQNFDTSIRTINPTYVYGKDFFLGDTITVIDKNLSVTIDAVVESVQRSISSQGEQFSITFGYSTPLLSQRLRKAGI